LNPVPETKKNWNFETPMTVYLDHSPFSDKPDELIIRGERVRIRENQIIAWVSLFTPRLTIPNPSSRPFPAILDTGHTHSFSIHKRHLIEWAGIEPDMLPARGARRDSERQTRIILREANLWLHCNQQGYRDRLVDQPAKPILTQQGIAVYSEGNFPRLPLLGLRVISENGLILKIDGQRRETTLRTPRHWWPFS
jgi:hypothetical protein